MRDHDETKPNNEQDDELALLRTLVGDAWDDEFSLDDIMAEFSDRNRPTGVVSLSHDDLDILSDAESDADETSDADAEVDADTPAQSEESGTENLLLFPGVRPPEQKEDTQTESDEYEDDVDEANPDAMDEDDDTDADEAGVTDEADDEDAAQDDAQATPDNVLEFPGLRSPLANFLQRLSRKADRFAAQMFSQEDHPLTEEERRREELVPGVDREDADASHPAHHHHTPTLSGPDTPPQDLARRYNRGLKSLRVRSLFILLLFLPALYVTLCDVLPIPAIPNPWVAGQPLLTPDIRNWVGSGLLLISMLLGLDVLSSGFRQLRHFRINTDALLLMSCVFSLLDSITAPFLLERTQTGYFALNMLALFYALQGEHHRRRGLRLACRTAASSAEPYLVTLDEGKWNGQDTYTKHTGAPEGFGRQIQAPDGAQKIFGVLCPILLCACFLLPTLSCLIGGRYSEMLWALAAVYTAAYPLSAPLLFSRPFHKLARRLNQCGAALAGWPGVVEQHRGDGILLGDQDLFPPGSVTINGMKIFNDFSGERVVGYTSTVIHASGCGLDRLFGELMRTQGILYRQADRLCSHEGGGLSANIRGDQVLVGSASFMKLQDIELPQGLNVNTAVFCAINNELAGLFALQYKLPKPTFPAVDALLQEHLSPVLATRDFNLIPEMLQQHCHLSTVRMTFPPIERRRELSDPEQTHNPILTAVLCREGLLPLSEAVVGARRLRRAVRFNAILGCIGAVLGTGLACYLTSVSAFASMGPNNLLLFLLLWLVPSWFITGGVEQY